MSQRYAIVKVSDRPVPIDLHWDGTFDVLSSFNPTLGTWTSISGPYDVNDHRFHILPNGWQPRHQPQLIGA
jgi:hypothetical protein